MKSVCALVFFGSVSLLAQKPPLTYSALATWPVLDVGHAQISSDGRYVRYTVDVASAGHTVIVQAVDRDWRRAFPGAVEGAFTTDSRHLVFKKGARTDSLGILSLANDSVQYIGPVAGYTLAAHGDGTWLAYMRADSTRTLVLHNLRTGEDRVYRGVADYELGDRGTTLVLQTTQEASPERAVVLVRMADGHRETIAHGSEISSVILDATESRVAFLVNDSAYSDEARTLRYYASGMDSARVAASAGAEGMTGFVVAEEAPLFGRDGRDLFFSVSRPVSRSAGVDTAARVTIRQSVNRGSAGTAVLAVTATDSAGHVVRLQQASDAGREVYAWQSVSENYITVQGQPRGSDEAYLARDVYLVSTRDGSRRLVAHGVVGDQVPILTSPLGQYLIWYDRREGNWRSYSVRDKAQRAITRGIAASWRFPVDDHPNLPKALGVLGWTPRDERVLIQSQYDIWSVDPRGETPPINLTHGVGARRGIRFRWIDFRDRQGQVPVIGAGDTLVLGAFNVATKENGFYRLIPNGPGALTELLMAPRTYFDHAQGGAEPPIDGNDTRALKPVKAKEAERYLMSVQTATEYPNLYVTSDFRTLTPITNLAPQRTYNWYQSELLRWKLPSGREAEGVLYKPEDFDPRKKYPVIIHYYEKHADGVYGFIQPALSVGTINIPWYVSNGYLVFVPDIYYTTGHPGRSALDCVVSGARYLARFPWVNARQMGIQGHSHAGMETYYIATHTSRFAAAAPSEGVTDDVAAYGQLSQTSYYEHGQSRIGASLYDRPDLYIANSAVFSAKRVTTPLLMLANTDDGTVPGRFGLEMLTAMQRLGKPSWLLDYAGEEHILENPKNQLDYSIRLNQFFDYYLKGAPPPKWMTKSVDDHHGDVSLQLDTSGVRP